MPVDQGIVDSVSTVNLKNLADAPAFYQALAMGNSVSQQQRQNDAAIAQQQRQNDIANSVQQAMGTALVAGMTAFMNQMTSVDPSQAMSEVKLLQSNLAERIAELSASLAATEAQFASAIATIQGLGKVVGTQPPVTVMSPGTNVAGEPTGGG